jgi:PAS domain S-box-containing protein
MNADLPVNDPVREPAPGLQGLALRYGGAVLAVAVAAGLRWLLHDLFGETIPYITFHPLVALVAMLAGGGPGVLATVLSGVIADVWIIAPDGRHTAAEAVGMGLYVATCLVMCTMGEMLRQAWRREKAGLEEQVAARMGDLRRANASLQKEIEDRRRAEQALREERDFADALVNGLPGLFYLIDADGKPLRWNRNAERVTGYSAEELTQMRPAEFVAEADRPALAARIREVFERGEASVELPLRTRDGRSIPYYFTGVRVVLGGRPYLTGVGIDLADRRRAEEALRESEERLRLMADALPVLIAYIGADGRYRFNNAAYERWFGRPADAYKGRHVREVMGEDVYAVLRGHVEAVLAGRPRSFEAQVPYPGVGTRDVLVHYVPHRGHDGRVLGFFALILDLTERKQAEEAVRRSEELQRAVLASLTSHIAVLGRDGRIVAVNPAWEEFARANGGDAGRCGVGADYLAVCRAAGGEAAEARRVADGLQDVLDGTADAFFIEYPCPFGAANRWFLMQATPLRTAGGGVVVSHMDITGRIRAEQDAREREARLRAILDTAADAIITIDGEGVIQSVNPATERMFGYVAAEMTGRNVRLLMPSPHWEEHDTYLASYRQTGVRHVIGIGRETEARRKDGTLFPVELAVSEVGHLPLFTGIIHDLTRRKELEREVVELVSLEQRRIGQDLHDSVAQELTALSLLAGDLAEALRADPAGGEKLVGRMAGGLRRSQEQLRAVMRGLLPVAVDAGGLMAALADLADRTRRDGKVACTFDCPEPIAVADNLVATHIYLIVQEAVRNAVKHARPRAVRIALEADHRLTLRVEDDGVGMPPRPSELQGLGLRIMRNRAAIIGAELTIGPAEPTGTVVTCVLARGRDGDQPAREEGPGADRR